VKALYVNEVKMLTHGEIHDRNEDRKMKNMKKFALKNKGKKKFMG